MPNASDAQPTWKITGYGGALPLTARGPDLPFGTTVEVVELSALEKEKAEREAAHRVIREAVRVGDRERERAEAAEQKLGDASAKRLKEGGDHQLPRPDCNPVPQERPTGECKVAMSGPTCMEPGCPPCRHPEMVSAHGTGDPSTPPAFDRRDHVRNVYTGRTGWITGWFWEDGWVYNVAVLNAAVEGQWPEQDVTSAKSGCKPHPTTESEEEG